MSSADEKGKAHQNKEEQTRHPRKEGGSDPWWNGHNGYEPERFKELDDLDHVALLSDN